MNLAPTFAPPSASAQLRRALAADVFKLKRTAALWLALGSGALPVVLTFFIFYFKGQHLLKPGENPWPSYVLSSWQTACALLLPLFVVLLTSLVLHVENKANAWKHVYAQPVGRGAVFGSKLLVLLGLNLVAQVLYVLTLLLSGHLLGLLRPELLFQANAAPVAAVGLLLIRTYVATLGLLALQYVAALWWRSFVLPVGLGMAATIAAMTLLRWEHIDWVPYAAPLLALRQGAPQSELLTSWQPLASSEWLSLGWFGLTLVVGYMLLGRRNRQI
jgi:hypothetical protein